MGVRVGGCQKRNYRQPKLSPGLLPLDALKERWRSVDSRFRIKEYHPSRSRTCHANSSAEDTGEKGSWRSHVGDRREVRSSSSTVK